MNNIMNNIQIKRKIKKEITIGNKKIGGNNRVLIQSMTTTKTKDIDNTVNQILELEKNGCDIIRVAVLDESDAEAIKEITKKIHIPLVADIHFDYKLALLSADNGANKIRINPGNLKDIKEIEMVINKCKEKNIPIRIGVNTGSIEKEIYDLYGNSAKALVESAKKHVKILEDFDFHNICLSLKASDVIKTIEAYKLANEEFNYPLHLGVTESGTKFSGTIKSSIGIGTLLSEGIGDTIRVSLTDTPLEEIKVCKEILSSLGLYVKPQLISCPTCGRCEYNMMNIVDKIDNYLNSLNNVNIKVAVMGCVVNGPGEAKDADIGIAGGKNCAVLFKKGEIIKKLSEDEIVDVLINEIDKMIK